ncbi:MAG: beta strand repeat-containing protein, partial [bacterium]
TLTISGGTATIQDDAVVSGVTTISGAGTNVTIRAGSLYNPTISTTTISNGTVNISNTTITGPTSVNAGTVTMTDNTSNAILGLSGCVLTVTRGTYSGAVAASGGTLSINGASLNNLNSSNSVLSLTGANTTVFNSSISAKALTNAVEISGASTFTVNMGNATTAGNNTFSILPGGTPFFIKNNSLNTVNAIGNTWNFNGTAMPNSSPTDAFAIQNYIQASGASANNGLVYFNAGKLYVLNNQQVTGINSISAVSDKSATNDIVYIQGGANAYFDNVQVVGKNLSFVGIANGTGTNPILGFNSNTVATPFFRFFEDSATPSAITNVLANLTFDGTGLTPSELASAILADGQYFLAGSALTLSGATTSTNFDTSTNPSLFQMAGGQLNVSTTGTLVGSLLFNPTVNSVFTLNSGSTVNGPLSISTVPSGVTFNATIAGTLDGPTASPIALYGGTITVTGTGRITGSPISIQGATFNLNGGTVTSAILHDSGTLNITGGTSSGTLTITGGTATISGGTFDASTATSPSSVNSIVTITGGTVTFTGGTINADNSNATYRDGIRIDGTGTGYIGSTVSISGLNVSLTPTNNISTAGIRVMGVNNTLYNAPNTVLTLGDGSTITNGDFSIVIGGVNSCLTGNKFGNLTLNNPDGTAFIKLNDSAYFNNQSQVPFHLDASQITYNPFYLSGGFRPADAPLGTPNNDQLQRLFTLESRIIDYTAGSDVGFVELYPGAGFAISGRELQRSINAVNSFNAQVYVH